MNMILSGISDSDYNQLDGVRSSVLSIIDRRTLAHAKASMDGGFDSDKGALILGQAAHDIILRPQVFIEKWGSYPEGYNGTTKEGRATKDRLVGAYGNNLIKHDDLMMLKEIQKSIESHPAIFPLLNGIKETEVSLVWDEQGVKCKARIDAITEIKGQTLLLDLKTSRSAEQSDFEKSCVNYGYLIQSAHYLAGAKACGVVKNDNNNFLHVVIEKEPPYLCAVYCLDDASLEVGEKRRQEALRKYIAAKQSGIWPGYSERVETIACPHWYFQQQDDLAA